MEIQPSQDQIELNSQPEPSPPFIVEHYEEPMMVEEPPQEILQQRVTRSSHKSSELQNQVELKSSAERHKMIQKKKDKSGKNKHASSKNKKIQRMKAAAARRAQEQEQVYVAPVVVVPPPVVNNIFNSIGYTIFTNHIEEYYLTKPTEVHFQKVDQLLLSKGLSVNSMLNELPEHQHRHAPTIKKYLELVGYTQRFDNEEIVAFKKQKSNSVGKKIVLVSYKVKGHEKQKMIEESVVEPIIQSILLPIEQPIVEVYQEQTGQKCIEQPIQQLQLASIQQENAKNMEIQEISPKINEQDVSIQVTNTFEVTLDDIKDMQWRKKFMNKLQLKQKQYCLNTGKQVLKMNEISKQLLFLNSLLTYQNKQNESHIKHLKTAMNYSLQQKQIERTNLMDDRMVELILRKNVRIAVSRQQITDLMNYYKLRAADQENREFNAITDHKKMIEYLKKKKPTKTKKPKCPIHSACTACLSTYTQQGNPFSHCHDCSSKIHKHCRKFMDNDDCKVCSIKRSKNKKKQFVQCVLCPNKGFTFTKVGNYNVHAFCTILTGKFKVQNQILKVPKQVLQIVPSCPPCFICYKSSHKLYKCSDSQLYFHSTCAFLHGYEMSFKQDILSIFSNALTTEDRFRQQFHRRYRMNYEGLVYRCFSLQEYRKQTLGVSGSGVESSKFSSSQKDQIVEGEDEQMIEGEEQILEGQEQEDIVEAVTQVNGEMDVEDEDVFHDDE